LQTSYSKNYIKIYFFQFLSIALGFVSLFVVVPYLSADQSTYGIYSVCIAITVFLSYADLGFLGAGMKYAAESYSRGDRKTEEELVGFSHFILLIFVLILSGIFLLLSFYPEMLIKGIEPGNQNYIAHSLLLILAIFSPTIILQRALQMIFGIRLQDYILQRINIVGNLVKIISVLYFFGGGRYNIISYFLFMQIVNLLCSAVGIFKAKKLFNYNFKFVLGKFKFSSIIFQKTKSLAFSSLFVTISWILYYELDSFAIARMLGAKEVAIYAIGLTILSFFRSMLGVFFSPFSARFNHFIGTGKYQELKQFYLHVITITLPIVVFPVVAVVIFARPLVISWVGIEYNQSVDIVRWLIVCNLLAFISYPAGMLLIAREQMRQMYAVSIFMPVVFWSGILITIGSLGVQSFAIFKFIAFVLSGIIYLWLSLNFLELSFIAFLRRNILPYLPALIVMSLGLFFFRNTFVDGKNKVNLLINAIIVGGGISVAIGFSFLTVRPLRQYLKVILKIIQSKQ
jgi:O-antigen/teichoic acid export membrane protein